MSILKTIERNIASGEWPDKAIWNALIANGMTDLIEQCEAGNTAIVKWLLDHGANVHAYDDLALRVAAGSGRSECVKLLLAAGADVHAYDDLALRWAAEYGHSECVEILLAAGADVHANNDYALQWAAKYGHSECVKLLKDWIENHE